MHEILPGILEQEWAKIEEKLKLVKPFAKTIHVDLLDGKFAPNTSLLDPTPFTPYTQDFFFELHMMVEEPIGYLDSWAKAGIQRFVGHVEKMSDQEAFVAKAQQLGEVGLAVDKDTGIDAITVPYQDLDEVLVMTVKAGFSGQTFLQEPLEKVRVARGKHLYLPICVDGGINTTTIRAAAAAGATRFVATSFLFGSDTPAERLQQLLDESHG